MTIYIEDKQGYLTGFALIPGEGLVIVEVDDYPTDVENWYWNGTTLTHDSTHLPTPEAAARALPMLQQQNAQLMKQVTTMTQHVEQSQTMLAQVLKEVAKLEGGKEDE
ncbi:hypothetical protein ACSFB8_07365 [Enterococcus faecalis]